MKNILVVFFVSFLFLFNSIDAQDLKVEPPSWWAGMKNPELQIMVHAENIANADVSINYPGVVVKAVTKPESPNYLFIDLEVMEESDAGSFTINFRKENGENLSYEYVLMERERGSANREGFNSSDVIYLLMPDRFANGNPENDIISGMRETELDRSEPYGRHGGDLDGIIENLDYFEEMGFTALWLNPVLENDQEEASYHGYAITDFYKVDPRFGTNEDYKMLADMAAEKGIKLIMDMIFNHCGSGHWWMDDLPFSDWINYYPEYKITNHRRTVNQDLYAAESDIKLMRDGWFVPTMPDLNQGNPYMADYLIQNSIWWIEYLGLGGIRMDTYPYPDKYVMAEWCERVLEEYPNFNIVGEEWTTNPITVSYWQKGKENHDGYEPHLPSVMDFPLQNAVSEALNEEETWGTGLIKIYEALSNDYVYPDPYKLVIFPDNHDMPRFYMQVGMDQDLYKLGITYFLTMRGIPQIYYGSEILMTHTEGDGHGYIRKDFPGGWEGDEMNAFTGENMPEDALEMQDFFKRLLNWRKENPVIHTGDITHYAPSDGIYVFFRYDEKDKVMVIINKNTEAYNLELNRFRPDIGDSGEALDVIDNKKVTLEKDILLEPKRAYVLEIL